MATENNKLEQVKLDLVNKLLDDMEQPGGKWLRDWTVVAQQFNPITKTVYRGRNAFLLMFASLSRGAEDPRWMTFAQAKKAGYSVRRGAESFPIEKWSEIFFLKEDPTERIKQPKTVEERKAMRADERYGSKVVLTGWWNVFNGEDIEGEGWEPYEDNLSELKGEEALDYLEWYSPVQVIEAKQDRAFYSMSDDKIIIPLRTQFDNIEGATRTVLHEMAHSTGHKSRLNREMQNSFGSAEYAFEELVAEISSLFTAQELGLKFEELAGDAITDDYWANHVAYIKNWAKRTEGEEVAKTVMKAATKAAEATSWLMTNCFDDEEKVAAAEEQPAAVLGKEAA